MSQLSGAGALSRGGMFSLGGALSKGGLLTLGTGGGWFNAAEFADFAAIADFNRDRYAITTVPLGSIPTATASELCVKRACTFAEWFAFTASSTTARSYTDVNGILRNDLAADQPRFDWVNGRRQLGLNAQSTNVVPSSVLSGTIGSSAPAGSTGSISAQGITGTIVSTGVEDGLSYVDIWVRGTSTGSIASVLYFGPTSIDHLAGLTGGASSVAASVHVKLIAGGFGSETLDLAVRENTSTGAFLTQTLVSVKTATGAPLGKQRFRNVVSPIQPTATGVSIGIRMGGAVGTTVDFTIRIAAPQLELGSIVSPFIPTAGAAVTRAIETARLAPKLEAILQRSSGSIVFRGQNAQGDTVCRIVGGAGNTGAIFRSNNTTIRSFVGTTGLNSTLGSGSLSGSFGAGVAYSPSGRSLVSNGGAITSDGISLSSGLTKVYLGRDETGAIGSLFADFIGIAPSRLSDARLAELAVPA